MAAADKFVKRFVEIGRHCRDDDQVQSWRFAGGAEYAMKSSLVFKLDLREKSEV